MTIKWLKTVKGRSEGHTLPHIPVYIIIRMNKDKWRLSGPDQLRVVLRTQRDCRRLADMHSEITLG